MAEKQSVYEITSFKGGISSFEDKGIPGAFKFGTNLDIRKVTDSLSAGQDLKDIGDKVTSASQSPSTSLSPSASTSPSISVSRSPSPSLSPSFSSPSASKSPSASLSPSASISPSASLSPSHSTSPSPSPSAGLTTQFADLVRFWVPCSDGQLYGFGHTGKVYKITPEFQVAQVYDLQKPITGAIEKPSSSGRSYFIFASRTELHFKLVTGRADWNDVDDPTVLQGWPKTNLTDADWHTMELMGGATMIANGSKAAMVGYDDSYTTEAVDLIPGNIVKTIVERNGRAVFGTYRQANPNKGINAAIDSEVPLAQVGDEGQLVYADFSNSMPVKRFPGGGKVNPGGVANRIEQVNFFDWEATALSWIDKQTVGNMAIWGVYGATAGYGGIYSYGRKDKDHQFVLNLDSLLDADEIGALVTVNGIDYVSYRSGSAFGVKVTDMANKATGTYEGLDFKAPVKTPEDITAWNTVELFMEPMISGCEVQFWYRVNKTGDFVRAKTASGFSSYTVAGGKKATFLIGAEGEIFEPRVVLVPTGNISPEVYRIRTYFN